MRGARTVGLVAIVGAAGIGVASWARSQGWTATSTLRTSATPGQSNAQTLSDLRSREAELVSAIASAEADIDTGHARRMANATKEGLANRIERECSDVSCSWWAVGCHARRAIDPYLACDDQVVATARAEINEWRADELAERVHPLKAQLATVRAEIDSLALTV